MKAVLISIRPEWCEKIASGEKTVEIRKTRPKLEPPFKCYIYMTKGDAIYPVTINGAPYTCSNVGGKTVIGEFVCDEICECEAYKWRQGGFEGLNYKYNSDLSKKSCVSQDELMKYGNRNTLYGWHISDLVIYDKPKELGEFKTFCKSYYDGDRCDDCKYFIDGRGYEFDESDCGCNGAKPIERPPQSWCYVEEVTL